VTFCCRQRIGKVVPAVNKEREPVESRRGAVTAFASRFPSPLIKPDVRISRIRLSDWFRDRLTTLRLTADNDAVSALQVRRTLRPC
jgi:hypothetical protein